MITSLSHLSPEVAETISHTISQHKNMLPVSAQEIIQKFRLNLFFIFYDDISQEYSFYQIKNAFPATAEMASVYGKGYLDFLIHHFNRECLKLGIKTAIAITKKKCIADLFSGKTNGKKMNFWDLGTQESKYAIVWNIPKKQKNPIANV